VARQRDRHKDMGLAHSLAQSKSKITTTIILVNAFCLVARVALCRPEVVHVSGQWSLLRRSGGELKMESQPQPFEAYIGKTNYYFHYSDKKEDWVGTRGYQLLMAGEWESLHLTGPNGTRHALTIRLFIFFGIGLAIFFTVGFYLPYKARKSTGIREGDKGS